MILTLSPKMGNDLFQKGMNMNKLGSISVSSDISGKEFSLETGKLGKLATGSAVCRVLDSVVLANVVVSNKADEERDYFPLTVDFEDKWYATGKISGSRFIKREGRPSELATLRSRMIDRSIRPMFPKGYMNEMQLIVTPLSLDESVDPVVMGINAASTALMLSGAPFEGPLGAVRVTKINGKIIFNPSYDETAQGEVDVLVAGTKDAITMIEATANEIPEEEFVQIIDHAHAVIKESIALQEKLLAQKEVKAQEYTLLKPSEEVVSEVKHFLSGKLGAAIRHESKMARRDILADLEDRVFEHFVEKFEEKDIRASFDKAIKEEVRRSILEEGTRPDHRKFDEIRALSAEVGILPRTHGSAVFNRGETQVLGVTTLGAPGKVLTIESMDQDGEKYFMHHYNDAPFAYGDIGRLGPGRRAIGHGYLAEKALLAIMPPHEEFPYTVRTVSEIMSCNGSSSMGSVSAASLSLADAGVPIKSHVAGIAMGLVTEDGTLNKKYEILTDIQAAEDFAGDMDFKAAGTHKGLTAFQLDIKIKGLNIKFIKDALAKARVAREQILGVMEETLSEPRKEMSKYAPKLTTLHINPEKIKTVIGKGGETINKIIAECNVEIDIEDDGTVVIAATSGDEAQAAIDWIKGLTDEPKVGQTYNGKVVKIMDFGAFVEFMPGQEGLVHISQIANERVEKVTDVLKEGQEVKVKLTEIDSQGRKNLSIKAAK